MIRIIKNIIIYIAVCIVILASIKVPEILLNIENSKIEMAVYEKQKKSSFIDVETEKIYLVKAIHEIENDNSTVEISSSNKAVLVETSKENFEKEILKLGEYNVIENVEINEDSKISIGIINKIYQNSSNQYIINNVDLEIDNKKYEVQIEGKTGKIIYISLEKNNFANKEKILENYIKYLDLYIIDDWKFEDDIMKSEKAQLIVALVESNNRQILSIHSTDNKITNYIDVTKKI